VELASHHAGLFVTAEDSVEFQTFHLQFNIKLKFYLHIQVGQIFVNWNTYMFKHPSKQATTI